MQIGSASYILRILLSLCIHSYQTYLHAQTILNTLLTGCQIIDSSQSVRCRYLQIKFISTQINLIQLDSTRFNSIQLNSTKFNDKAF